MSGSLSADRIRAIAHEEGFDLVGFGPIDPGPDGPRFARWLDAGRAGSMDYLHRTRELILEPHRWAPDAETALCLGFDYGRPEVELEGGGRVARYAGGRDYHSYLGKATKRLRRRLEDEGMPANRTRCGTDAVPVLERALAARAGIGFLAKSAGIISPTLGPYLHLGELLLPIDVPFDAPSPGSCGTCTRCLDACPTDAIVAPHEVDATRCLSYTTIELDGPIPRALREAQGDWLFGCDVCLDVCPFTSKGRTGSSSLSTEAATALPPPLETHRALATYSLLDIVELDAEEWDRDWTGTPLRRAGRSGLRRNAAVVLGNLGDDRATDPLTRAVRDPDPIVRGHAAWALGRIAPRHPALDGALATESDPWVRSELTDALDA